jgi:hypothetical protein
VVTDLGFKIDKNKKMGVTKTSIQYLIKKSSFPLNEVLKNTMPMKKRSIVQVTWGDSRMAFQAFSIPLLQ